MTKQLRRAPRHMHKCLHAGDDAQPDWAALFPIPASRRIEDRPQQRRRLENGQPQCVTAASTYTVTTSCSCSSPCTVTLTQQCYYETSQAVLPAHARRTQSSKCSAHSMLQQCHGMLPRCTFEARSPTKLEAYSSTACFTHFIRR